MKILMRRETQVSLSSIFSSDHGEIVIMVEIHERLR